MQNANGSAENLVKLVFPMHNDVTFLKMCVRSPHCSRLTRISLAQPAMHDMLAIRAGGSNPFNNSISGYAVELLILFWVQT